MVVPVVVEQAVELHLQEAEVEAEVYSVQESVVQFMVVITVVMHSVGQIKQPEEEQVLVVMVRVILQITIMVQPEDPQ
jgi:hypothetical protein